MAKSYPLSDQNSSNNPKIIGFKGGTYPYSIINYTGDNPHPLSPIFIFGDHESDPS